ncbi:kinase-like protein [Thermothelomyces heterothallicus CBS 203.75]
MKPVQPRIIGVGTTCYVTTTDNKTVLKGHQVWSGGNLVFDYGDSCEKRLAREATIYKHLGRHPQILECFGLEEVHPGIHSLRLEIAPLGSLRAYIHQTANNAPSVLCRLRMALDVATGLGYLHSRGVMACDLSSTNLFVFDDLKVKLGDFGGALLEGAGFEWDQTHETRYHLPARGRAYDEVPIMKRELFSLGYSRDEFPSLGGNVAGQIIQNCWGEVYATAQEVIADLKA